MTFIHDTLIVFRRQMRLSLRNPAWVIIALVQPILYLALFGPLLTKVPLNGSTSAAGTAGAYKFFVPGLLIQLGLFGSTFVGFAIISDWRAGVIERFRVTPVSRLAIMSGRVLRDVLTLLVQAVILVLVAVAFGLRAPVTAILLSLGFIALVAVGLASASYATALLVKSEDAFAPMLNSIVVPLILLSGIMLPMTLGPGWLQGIARISPFRYIIDAMRSAFAGQYATTVMLEGVLVAVGLAAVCLWLGSRVFVRENAEQARPRARLPRGLGEMAGGPVPGRQLGQRRLGGLADVLRLPAPGVEAAAGRRVQRARHIPRQPDPLPADPGADRAARGGHPGGRRLRHRDRGQQRHGVRVPRAGVELVPVGEFHDLAEVHHRYLVADVPHHRQVVGDDHVAQPQFVLQVVEQVDHLGLDGDVERGDRLVGHDQLGPQRQRPGDADALPLAAGELVGVPVVVLGVQAHQLKQVLDGPLDALLGADVLDPQRRPDDCPDRVPRVQRRVRVLEDHADLASQRAHLARSHVRDVLAVEDDAAGGGLVKPGDHAPGGRLAAPRLADDAEGLAGGQREVDPVHRAHVGHGLLEDHAPLYGEVPGQPGHGQQVVSHDASTSVAPCWTSGSASTAVRGDSRSQISCFLASVR